MSDLVDRNRAAFAALCQEGTYTHAQRHAEHVVRFFHEVLARTLPRLPARTPLRVLDAGMGTGAWLAELAGLLHRDGRAVDYFGFDYTPDMVQAASRRLDELGVSAVLAVGDLADPASYHFAAHRAGGDAHAFDLIVVFDVVQQLPRRRQPAAFDCVLAALAPGGTAVVFDQDLLSPFGLKMAVKKTLTRYLGLRLVPAYFTLARYPAVGRLAARARARGLGAEVIAMRDGPKRALVVTRPAPGRG